MKKLSFALAVTAALSMTTVAFADSVTWTDWTSSTAGGVSGMMGSVSVTYTGQTSGLGLTYASGRSYYPGEFGGTGTWAPVGSYTGTGVDNAPPTSDNLVSMEGGDSDLQETISFNSTVVDPYIAIWSLGAGGNTAAFDFNNTVTVIGGGISDEYGGGSIYANGNNVYGEEGNGVIQVMGTFDPGSSITFTTPVYEDWYGFTVGEAAATPEPGGLVLLGTGLLAASLLFRRKPLS